MNKFRITNQDTGDYFDIEADNLDEIRIIARQEVGKRGWSSYFSEKVNSHE